MEIQVKVHHRWRSEESLIRRIARITCYDDTRVETQDTGYTWRLDDSSDWWAEVENFSTRNVTVKVAWRYGGGGNEPIMAALKVFLEFALG